MLPTKSWVSSREMRKLCTDVGYKDQERLDRVCSRLENGANIGCVGRARLPTVTPNGKSTYDFGARVADSLQDWIDQGIVVGPLTKEEIPWTDITINQLMVRLKPNMSARIILNMSSPETEIGPAAVNTGINGADFEARMSSTAKFVESLAKAGVGALMCKSDWCSAYKHQHVRNEDLRLQFIEFGGRLFCELMLVFGAISSPGIFDDLAKVVLGCAIIQSGISADMVQQHLDDVCAVGTEEDGSIYSFDMAYRQVAERVGVKLAPRDDPDKSFAPATDGLVLGVVYSTRLWTWSIREDKLARIIHLLGTVIRGEEVTVVNMLSLAGKLVDVRFLVPDGRFHLGFIISAANSSMDKSELVHQSPHLRDQCRWWVIHLQAAAFQSPIVRPVQEISPLALKGWSDAAGGSLTKVGQGVGGVVPPNLWVYIPWPAFINNNKPNTDGVKFARKPTCLELCGPLIMLCGAPSMYRNTELVVYVDNQGSVDIWRKGFSTSCFYSYTIVKAINDVARGLNAKVHIQKITRCSDAGSLAADALSKANFKMFKELMPTHNVEMCRVPRSFLHWLRDPVVTMDLGH